MAGPYVAVGKRSVSRLRLSFVQIGDSLSRAPMRARLASVAMNSPTPPIRPDTEDELDRLLQDFLAGAEHDWSWPERKAIFSAGIAVAQRLDEFVRRVDPLGEPPRFEALMYQRLRRMERAYKGGSLMR